MRWVVRVHDRLLLKFEYFNEFGVAVGQQAVEL